MRDVAAGETAPSDDEPFWDRVARTGDYRIEIADLRITTEGRDRMMNLLSAAPTAAAADAFYKTHLDRLAVMGNARVTSRIEVFKALERRKKDLGELG
jgi:hypothetical protein